MIKCVPEQAKDMDMEKGMQQAIAAATDAQVPPMTTGKGEKEPLLLNLQVQPVLSLSLCRNYELFGKFLFFNSIHW